MEDDNWDLQAVVRGCSAAVSSTSTSTTSTATTTTTTTTPTWSTFQPLQGDHFLEFPDLFEPEKNSIEHLLNDLFNPLIFPKLHKALPLSPQTLPISPISVLGGLQDLSQQQQQQKQLLAKKQTFGVSRSTTSHAQSTRPKKRKNQMKRVCQVPAEGLSSDTWSWRKYGQKPIKGSPYPRGYYRCSTSKGCLARKQVERNRSDPNMFIVTYTGEHNHPMPTHRNSLAGSTRQKPISSGDESNKPTCSSPSASLSPAKTEEREDTVEDDDDDDNVVLSDMAIEDDFFDGLDELVAPATGGCFPSFPGQIAVSGWS